MKQTHQLQGAARPLSRKIITLSLLALGSVAVAQTTTIEFWHTFGDAKRSDWIAARADDYTKAHPGVQVKAVFRGDSNETLQSTILAARQNKAPALVQVDGVASQLALDSGVFQPVSSIKNVDFSDYLKPVVSYYTVGGQVNSVPFNSSSPVLYFNKDLMVKAGLNPKNPPTTFSGVLKACAQFDAAKLGIKCVALTPYSWLFEQWMSEQNVALLNSGNGRQGRPTDNNINSAAGRKIYQFYKDLQDRGELTNTGKLADTVGTNAIFGSGKALMTINSTAGLGNLLDAAKQSGFQMGVGVLPIPDGVKRNGVTIGGASLWVAKGVSKPEAETALDFALYLTNTANMASWHKLTGYYPVRTSSVNLLRKQGWFSSSPLQIVAFNQLLNTVPNVANAGPLSGATIQTRTIIEQGIQKVLSGQSVASALSSASDQVNAALADYNKNFK
ncbi:ABC transporter substrate-binding protein (plasmid) [Deinococcus sp. KNUC1210]|uniref:ABC transporter substrate-binding protein n=1 Tax=Deinococcus sp. KNUC1210 TaxID=2917691 RepID=UPI001EF0E048|nr:ABC transporter substrate-binding protein [Deinococcus sp. KNUC1210]ULH17577.1 ABC transporter substrate-binding protein [Deinococcus sp. KNUC1210]